MGNSNLKGTFYICFVFLFFLIFDMEVCSISPHIVNYLLTWFCPFSPSSSATLQLEVYGVLAIHVSKHRLAFEMRFHAVFTFACDCECLKYKSCHIDEW